MTGVGIPAPNRRLGAVLCFADKIDRSSALQIGRPPAHQRNCKVVQTAGLDGVVVVFSPKSSEASQDNVKDAVIECQVDTGDDDNRVEEKQSKRASERVAQD